MNIERMTQLLYMLRNFKTIFPDVRFDLTSWAAYEAAEENECGTAACAFGAACVYPPFMEQGLRISRRKLEERKGYSAATVFYKDPDGELHEGFEAAEAFFGIDDAASSYLFSADTYPEYAYLDVPVSEVADRVEKMIGGYIPTDEDVQLLEEEYVRATDGDDLYEDEELEYDEDEDYDDQ